MSKFIYFPSFSAGEYGDKLKKDFKSLNIISSTLSFFDMVSPTNLKF